MKCHLCGLPINLTLRNPHPLSMTQDHVIPKVLGGSSKSCNFKPAHKMCNNERGALPLRQDNKVPDWLRRMLRKVIEKGGDPKTIRGHMRYQRKKYKKCIIKK